MGVSSTLLARFLAEFAAVLAGFFAKLLAAVAGFFAHLVAPLAGFFAMFAAEFARVLVPVPVSLVSFLMEYAAPLVHLLVHASMAIAQALTVFVAFLVANGRAVVRFGRVGSDARGRAGFGSRSLGGSGGIVRARVERDGDGQKTEDDEGRAKRPHP